MDEMNFVLGSTVIAAVVSGIISFLTIKISGIFDAKNRLQIA